MNVTCNHCKTKLNIPDQKILKDKETVFKCPKCREKVVIPAPRKAKPISSISFEDRRNALVCIDNPELKKNVYSVIRQMDFNAEVAMDTRDALERMEYHIYHLVIIDESFDQNRGSSGILKQLDSVDMSLRRRTCLVQISSRVSSNDNMMALHSSVNSIIHQDDIPHLESFLNQVLTEHNNFYMVYNDSMKQAGKV